MSAMVQSNGVKCSDKKWRYASMKHGCGKRTDVVHVETETRTLMTPVGIKSATNKTSERRFSLLVCLLWSFKTLLYSQESYYFLSDR